MRISGRPRKGLASRNRTVRDESWMACAPCPHSTPNPAKPLMAVQLPRTDGEADHHLVIDLPTPDIQMLRRDIHRHGVGDLVLHAFKDRDLSFRGAGFLPEI